MKKVRVKKQYGVWFYKKIMPNYTNDLDAPIWELYDEDENFEATFGSYGDMVYFIETGTIL